MQEVDFGFFVSLFGHTLSFWWLIIPAIFLGLIVGAIPGFSAANTIIILLPLTLAMGRNSASFLWWRCIARRAWARAFRRSW